MKIPPTSPTLDEVLRLVQRDWRDDADAATYVPVGFGAHHWRIDASGAPILFATFDVENKHRSLNELERAFTSAASLESAGFGHAVAPNQSRSGAFTVRASSGVLSVTSWLDGRTPTWVAARESAHVARIVDLLSSLHSCDAPPDIPEWRPRVDIDLVASLRERVQAPWEGGPFGEIARTQIMASLEMIADSLREYHLLAAIAMSRKDRWVVTHGEPHWANQFIVGDELFLIDWDTIALAPPEIDAVDLPFSARAALGCDEEMLRMFRLEWQLAEIAEYAEWFQNHHTGTEDDALALEKLQKELRPA